MIIWLIIFVWFTVALMPDKKHEWRSNWLRLSFAPDFIIGGKDDPYMLRWWVLPRNKWFNVYLHKILRDDDDRALHDHPSDNCSLILRGRYREVTLCRNDLAFIERSDLIAAGVPHCAYTRKAGTVTRRKAEWPHRLELIDGQPCWTLFITGPRRREWGFHTANGWVHWKDFTDPNDRGVTRK